MKSGTPLRARIARLDPTDGPRVWVRLGVEQGDCSAATTIPCWPLDMVIPEGLPTEINAAEFKAERVNLLDEVAATHEPLVIIKRGPNGVTLVQPC